MACVDAARSATGSITPSSVVVLTGATSGIGLAAARLLAARAGVLVLHGPEPHDTVADRLAAVRSAGSAEVHYVAADYDQLDEVVALADRVCALAPWVDVLVNNAGRPGAPRRTRSSDGHEATLQTNYLAAVLLTRRLLDAVGCRRVVHVASSTHHLGELQVDDLDLERHPYSAAGAYARSKLGLVAHALWLAERLRDGPTEVVSLHPGVIATGLLHAMFGAGGAPVARGAENVVAAAGSAAVRSGDYLDDGERAVPSERARDRRFQHELAEATEALLGPWLPAH